MQQQLPSTLNQRFLTPFARRYGDLIYFNRATMNVIPRNIGINDSIQKSMMKDSEESASSLKRMMMDETGVQQGNQMTSTLLNNDTALTDEHQITQTALPVSPADPLFSSGKGAVAKRKYTKKGGSAYAPKKSINASRKRKSMFD